LILEKMHHRNKGGEMQNKINCGRCGIRYKTSYARRDEKDDSLTICPKCNHRNPVPPAGGTGQDVKQEVKRDEVPPVR
jgi:NAD-dependent SIR2 family protein deacetylase